MRCFIKYSLPLLLLVSSPLVAIESPLKDFNFGVGNLSQFIGRLQTNEAGDRNGLTFEPFVGAEFRIDLTPRWSLAPEFAVGLPREGRDSNITKLTYWVSGSVGYSIRDYILQAGLGLFMNRVSGSGGSSELPNGTGTDSFPLPDGSATSTNLTTHIGLRYFFLPDWSAKTQLHVYNLEDSDERAVSWLLMFSYHLGDFLAKDKP